MKIAQVTYEGRKVGATVRFKLFAIWNNIRNRTMPTGEDGVLGVKMWGKWEDFQQFVTDVGLPPAHQYGLYRLDSRKDWMPNNVVWSHRVPITTTGRLEEVEYNGETKYAEQWAEIAGLHFDTFKWRRTAGWTMEQIMTTPARKKVSRKANYYLPTTLGKFYWE